MVFLLTVVLLVAMVFVALLHVGLIGFELLGRHDLLQLCVVGLHGLGHLLMVGLVVAMFAILWRLWTLGFSVFAILWWFRTLSLTIFVGLGRTRTALWTMMGTPWVHLVGIFCVQLEQLLGLLVVQLIICALS